MSDALEKHESKVSTGDKTITNLRFADDIAEEGQELVESLDKACIRYKMEINAESTKPMKNSASSIQRENRVKGKSCVPLEASGTMEQWFQIMAQNQRFCQGLRKSLQLLQN